MVKRVLIAATLLLALAAPPAGAATLFVDTFNTENGGVGTLNYNGFANFAVSNGTVDLIGSPGFWEFPPVTNGHGLYVDLDGSSSDAGLVLADAIPLIAGNYTLSFQLAGNQRNLNLDVVDIDLFINGGSIFHGAIAKPGNEPFLTYFVPFNTAGGNFTFAFANAGGDNIGALLDNIELTGPAQVPEPGALLLLGVGLVFGLVRRRH